MFSSHHDRLLVRRLHCPWFVFFCLSVRCVCCAGQHTQRFRRRRPHPTCTTLHSDPRPTRRLRHSDITPGDPRSSHTLTAKGHTCSGPGLGNIRARGWVFISNGSIHRHHPCNVNRSRRPRDGSDRCACDYGGLISLIFLPSDSTSDRRVLHCRDQGCNSTPSLST